jgi:hypothetical protein
MALTGTPLRSGRELRVKLLLRVRLPVHAFGACAHMYHAVHTHEEHWVQHLI